MFLCLSNFFLFGFKILIAHIFSHSLELKITEEMGEFRASWVRHLDIMLEQEGALFEQLESLDFDPRLLPEYASVYSISEVEAHKRTPKDLDSEMHDNQQMPASSSSSTSSSSSSSSSAAAASSSSSSSSSLMARMGHRINGRKQEVKWHEEVVEVDVDNLLPSYEQQALEDALVLRFSDHSEYPPVDPARYPASFAAVTPMAVLHALYHAE